jgi:hypothetical protein
MGKQTNDNSLSKAGFAEVIDGPPLGIDIVAPSEYTRLLCSTWARGLDDGLEPFVMNGGFLGSSHGHSLLIGMNGCSSLREQSKLLFAIAQSPTQASLYSRSS